jgi:hypothetical protein
MQGEPFGRAKGTRGQTLAGESNPSYLHYLQYIQHCTVPYARLAVVRPCLAHRPHISGNLTVYLSPYLERPARHEKSARPYKPPRRPLIHSSPLHRTAQPPQFSGGASTAARPSVPPGGLQECGLPSHPNIQESAK